MEYISEDRTHSSDIQARLLCERPQSVRLHNRQPADDIAEMPSVYAQKRFKPIYTLWAILVSLLLQVILVLTVFLLQFLCSKISCRLPASLPITSVVAYVHVGVWFLLLLLHLYLRRQHNISRRYGYGMFYRRTLCLRRLTFYVSSVATVMLLTSLLVFADNDYCAASNCLLSPIHWIQLFVSIEAAACLIFLTVYLVQTVSFIRQQSPPDVFRESLLVSDSMSSRIFLGYRNHSVVEELLERQQDTITYLTERCQHLTELLSLTQPTGLGMSAASSTNDLSVSAVSSTAVITE